MSTQDHQLPPLDPATAIYMLGQINTETGKKFTEAEIGALWGLSKARVSQIKNLAPGDTSQTLRQQATRHFPWKLTNSASNSNLARCLRDHLEYVFLQGKSVSPPSDMSPRKLRDLASFYRKLETENVVVEYDPTLPAVAADRVAGWILRPRQKSDGDLIIRVNKYATMTEEAYILFRRPESPPTKE